MTIQPAIVRFEASKARALWHDYKKHLHYAKPIDREIGRAYQLLAQGKLIIRAYDSIKAAGLNNEGRPVLALARADWKQCECVASYGTVDGWIQFRATWRDKKGYLLPTDPCWRGAKRGLTIPPIIPLNVRPKRGLQNYAILWEAEWQPVPPHDPLLLRRIGKSDLWLVVAQWDLTEIEQAVLATRIRA